MANFFDEEQNKETPNTPQVFTVGDKQYTEDQLNELVNLGEMSKEAQIRYNTDLTKVYPEYIKTTQRVKELEEKENSWTKQQQDQRFNQGQLTPEEIRERALEEASNLGLWNERNAPQYIKDYLDGRELAYEADDLVDQLSGYGIQTDRETLLNYMDQNDISNPYRAADELYDIRQLEKDAQDQGLNSLRDGEDFVTSDSEFRSNRLPEGVKVTDNNMTDLLREALGDY